MQPILYWRRRLSFSNGHTVHTSTMLTVQVNTEEDEATFTHRLLCEWAVEEGTIEIVFKAGCPQYAVITLGPEAKAPFTEGV